MVVVMVTKLLLLVTCTICVRRRGHGPEVTRILYHISKNYFLLFQILFYSSVLTGVDLYNYSHLVPKT